MRLGWWLGWLGLVGCWRDPDAIAARFAAARAADTTPEVGQDAGLDTSADVTACTDDNPCTLNNGTPGSCVFTPLTGADCSAAAPCLVAPTCLQGQCQGPNRYWARKLQIGAWQTQLDAVDTDETGQLVAFGAAQVPQLQQSVWHPFALQLRDDGEDRAGGPPQPRWLKQDPSFDHRLAGLDVLHTGDGSTPRRWLAVGHKRELTAGGRTWAWWAQVTAKDGIDGEGLLLFDGSHQWQALARAEDGSFLAVGLLTQDVAGPAGRQGLLTRFAKDGSKGWTRALLPPGDSEQGVLTAVAAIPGKAASWLAVGYTGDPDQSGEPRSGWVVELAGPGTEVVWQAALPAPDAGQGWIARLDHVAPLSKDEALVGGSLWNTQGYERPTYVPYNGAGEFWLLKLQLGTGAVVWQRRWSFGGTVGFARWQPARHLLLFGDIGDVAQQKPAGLHYADALGNLLPLQQPLHHNGQTAARLLADGKLLLAGRYDDLGLLQVVSPWGANSCQNHGVCTGVSAQSCDDQQPCTLDHCDPTQGCVHLPLDNGSTCSGGSCQEAKCTP